MSPLTKTSRPFGQDMASLDNNGQDMARFVVNDDPFNNDQKSHDGYPSVALTPPMGNGNALGDARPEAPLGADRMLSGRLAEHLKHQPLQTEEDRLRAEVLQLRAEAAASRGLIEEHSRRARIYSTAGGRGTRGVSWIEAE